MTTPPKVDMQSLYMTSTPSHHAEQPPVHDTSPPRPLQPRAALQTPPEYAEQPPLHFMTPPQPETQPLHFAPPPTYLHIPQVSYALPFEGPMQSLPNDTTVTTPAQYPVQHQNFPGHPHLHAGPSPYPGPGSFVSSSPTGLPSPYYHPMASQYAGGGPGAYPHYDLGKVIDTTAPSDWWGQGIS
ncbi:hypothetical protein N7539_001490 [Penicillium diatomitis]|uniref:Uncharacterized protein n=1 Tax=Penicillium diatomitis TaxID=2819901 RepID=A0A9X0C095_9EURO|nr:uncharacterized protein N7539_001490 [Penicillium diatomitis]KAJ5492744.1 hypothetical protein N7539_001490 [Penicillium diatomitis]